MRRSKSRLRFTAKLTLSRGLSFLKSFLLRQTKCRRYCEVRNRSRMVNGMRWIDNGLIPGYGWRTNRAPSRIARIMQRFEAFSSRIFRTRFLRDYKTGDAVRVLFRFQFPGFYHAAKRSRNGRERIGFVRAKIKSRLHQSLPDAVDCKNVHWLVGENFSDRIRQGRGPRSRFLNGGINFAPPFFFYFIGCHVYRCIQELPQFYEFNGNLFALAIEITKTLKRTSNNLFLVRPSHRRSMRHCLTHVK